MNVKRFIGAALAIFVFMSFYEWLVHDLLLIGLYKQALQVWRPFAEIRKNTLLAIGAHLIISFWLAFAFTQVYPKGGIKNGLRFGLFFGVFAGIQTGLWYLWIPVSQILGWSWLITGILEGIGSGFLLGWIYKNHWFKIGF